jgi:hypothetical protein
MCIRMPIEPKLGREISSRCGFSDQESARKQSEVHVHASSDGHTEASVGRCLHQELPTTSIKLRSDAACIKNFAGCTRIIKLQSTTSIKLRSGAACIQALLASSFTSALPSNDLAHIQTLLASSFMSECSSEQRLSAYSGAACIKLHE